MGSECNLKLRERGFMKKSVRDRLVSGRPAYRVLLASFAIVWCVQPLSLVAATGYRLPLKASSNDRYLVDQNGAPFLVMGDSPQSMVGNLSVSDMATYMADRESLGFDAILVDTLCESYTGCNSNGTTFDGIPPFTSGSNPSDYDLATPSSIYFSRVDKLIILAAVRNLVVFLDPIETGG